MTKHSPKSKCKKTNEKNSDPIESTTLKERIVCSASFCEQVQHGVILSKFGFNKCKPSAYRK